MLTSCKKLKIIQFSVSVSSENLWVFKVNDNLKSLVPSNLIYQHKTNVCNWAGVQWDIDAHVGT